MENQNINSNLDSKTNKMPTTINKIKQEEKEAEKLIDQAKTGAEQMVTQAKTDVQKIISEAENLSAQESDQSSNEAKTKIAAIKASAETQIKNNIDKLCQIPHNKIDQATDLVIAALMQKHIL